VAWRLAALGGISEKASEAYQLAKYEKAMTAYQ